MVKITFCNFLKNTSRYKYMLQLSSKMLCSKELSWNSKIWVLRFCKTIRLEPFILLLYTTDEVSLEEVIKDLTNNTMNIIEPCPTFYL